MKPLFEPVTHYHTWGTMWFRLAVVLVVAGVAVVCVVGRSAGTTNMTPGAATEKIHPFHDPTSAQQQVGQKEESMQTSNNLHIESNTTQQAKSPASSQPSKAENTSKTTLTVNGKTIRLPANSSVNKTIKNADGSTLHISAENSASGSSSSLKVTSESVTSTSDDSEP